MKLKFIFTTLLGLLFTGVQAQDRTTVSATSSEISDNLDLRAVASIFGDSKNLEDFENRLNDPKNQISNLDLNDDNQVDYLRVVESVEGNAHIIVVQSVLGRDVFQDVATLEVEKDRNNRVQVQVVGDVYMYGANYIYEPVYVHTPVIYSYFWVPNYRPYCSTWYWGFYPSYYYAWNPFPVFRYRSHIGLFINHNHHYNYVNYRRCEVAYNHYYGRRANGYERQYPTRSFASRNTGYTNRHELDRTRNIRTVGEPRNQVADNGTRGNTRNGNIGLANPSRENTTRDYSNESPRPSREVKNTDSGVRSGSPRDMSNDSPRPRGNTTRDIKGDAPRSESNPRSVISGTPSRDYTPRSTQMESPRSNPRSNETRNFGGGSPRAERTPSVGSRSNAPSRSEGRSISNSNPNRGGGQSRGSDRR